MTISVDVSDGAGLSAAADEAAQRWGGIDIWINNAMATMFAPVSQMTCAEYARITEVTYLGYVYGAMAALRHMRPRNRGGAGIPRALSLIRDVAVAEVGAAAPPVASKLATPSPCGEGRCSRETTRAVRR